MKYFYKLGYLSSESCILFISVQSLVYCLSQFRVLYTVSLSSESCILFLSVQSLVYCLSPFRVLYTVYLSSKSCILFIPVQSLVYHRAFYIMIGPRVQKHIIKVHIIMHFDYPLNFLQFIYFFIQFYKYFQSKTIPFVCLIRFHDNKTLLTMCNWLPLIFQ